MRIAAMALALLFAHGLACAQSASYPSKPIHLVVGFPAGGASDVAARALAQKMSERMGRPMIVDNNPGAASNIGADQVAKAAPDGYTVLFGTISLAINPGLYQKLSYDPLKDLAAVAQVSSAPFLLVVTPKSPINSVKELLALARSKTGAAKIDYATAGNGSGSHLFMELFASLAGIQLSHIPYKGAAPAMNDVLGGQVPLTFDNIITTLPLVKAGRLRALAVSSAQRSKAAPDIPTLAEAGVPGYDATSWFGLFVPAGTPQELINRLSSETAEALKDAKVRDALLAVGSEPVGTGPQAFDAFFRAEVEKWARVVRDAKVRVD
jgi:tripartite-type tricarboxylate transporter receptor subunit TctC